jgi:tRNA/rRNA methyltransferase
MANFGLSELIIVNPRDGFPNEKATAVAAGATWVLDDAKLFQTTNEAIAEKTIIFATSGTPRQLDKPLISPSEAVTLISQAMKDGHKPIVLFGNERLGLDQIDLIAADYIVTYPTDFKYPSLNLAQSIAIFSYLWAVRDGDKLPDGWNLPNHEAAPRKYFENMFEFLINELDEIGFFWPADRRENMVETLKNSLVRAQFSESEINLFRGAMRVIAEGPRRRFEELKRNEYKDEIRKVFEAAKHNGSLFFETTLPNDAEIKEIIIEGKRAILIYSNQERLQYIKIDTDRIRNV